MILLIYLPLLALLLWGVYNGDIYPREAGSVAAIFILLQVALLLLKQLEIGGIITYIAMLIYIILRLYGGDVKIR